MDMFNLQNDDVSKLQFGSLEIAYTFYCWFAKMNNFAARKVFTFEHNHKMLKEKRCRLLACNRKLRFLKKGVHSQIARQRKEMSYDAKGVVRYLIDLHIKDQLMFVAHTVGADGTLQNLFWSDGES
ncbi:unnamed protein product [Vicia faba]|uniref:Protein FAR1-RELATED SEQUENCE n=1 Tax=Vicia faba TaxID=3906 RepID=A0AAV1B0S1_VICFA|nr:unnamed protein product [Vicia faba]